MGLLSSEELKQLLPAETSAFPSPIPTQSVSSDEFMPAPQTAKQREFDEPFVVDSSRIAALGVRATPIPEALERTLAAYRADHG